jgi:hypothetical protein
LIETKKLKNILGGEKQGKERGVKEKNIEGAETKKDLTFSFPGNSLEIEFLSNASLWG